MNRLARALAIIALAGSFAASAWVAEKAQVWPDGTVSAASVAIP